MTASGTPAFWDATCEAQGHTGWADALVYRYDQPLRLRAVSRAIDRLHPGGLKGRRALDIGCGTGDFVDLLARRGAEVVGIDLSPRVIERARPRFAANPRVRLEPGSITEARFEMASFDLVTSVTVLQHVTDDEALAATLCALRQALKPGGHLLLLELAPPRRGTVRHAGFPVVERPPQYWATALAAAGFAVASEETYPQAGITALRGLSTFLDRVRPGASEQAQPASDPVAGRAAPVSLARRLLRAGWMAARRATLAASRPVDYGLSMATPRRWRYYRLFVARAAAPQGAD